MPRYNGPISFVFEIISHLLRCYVVIGLFYFGVAGVFVALLGAGLAGFATVAMLLASGPAFAIGMLQFLTMAWFGAYFRPRFPYAPMPLTLMIAALYGALIVTAALAFERVAGLDESVAWADAHRGELLLWFSSAFAASALASVFGSFFFDYMVGGFLSGPGRWIGWLVVGRDAYDAFVERESERLGRAYDAHAQKVRGS